MTVEWAHADVTWEYAKGSWFAVTRYEAPEIPDTTDRNDRETTRIWQGGACGLVLAVLLGCITFWV